MSVIVLVLFAQPLVTLNGGDRPFAEAVAALAKQSGVKLTIEPTHRPGPVSLDLKGVTPWQALDTLARRSGSRLDLGRAGVTLAPARPGEASAPTHYDGSFRVRVASVRTSRDLLTGEGATSVSLEVGWLPTIRPLFLESSPRDLRVRDAAGRPLGIREEAATLVPADDRPSHLVELPLPAVPRSADHLGAMSGKFNVVVLGEMLLFDFDTPLDGLMVARPTGAQRQLTRSGVIGRVADIIIGRDRWTVRLALDYPAGANRDFESFQAGSMVVANELRLISADGKTVLSPSASVAEETGPRRTVVSFHFVDGPTGKRGTPGMWRVRYRAPARITDATVGFSFARIPLP